MTRGVLVINYRDL